MKKALLILVCLGLGLVPATALARDTVPKVATIMDGATAIAASQDYSGTTTTFYVSGVEGFFAIQASATGNGTAKVEYYTSIDGVTFAEPAGATDIIAALTSASGTVTVQFFPDYCERLRIVVTETGGVSTITPTIRMIYR